MTVGSSIALLSPWGTWKNAPMGRLMPCTKHTEAFEKAMPPCVAPASSPRRSAVRGTPFRIYVRDNPGNGFFTDVFTQYVYNDDAVNPNPGPFTWTQTFFLPVGISAVSVE